MDCNKQKINRLKINGINADLEKDEFKIQGLDWKDYMNAAYTVHNKYGFGFWEKFYHNSLLIESTGIEIGLLVNFEKSDEVRRKIIGKSV